MVVLVSTQHVYTAPLGMIDMAKGLVGGLTGFVRTIRHNYGDEGEFATKNGFDYDHVYNGMLQYQVINAYLNKNNAEVLTLLKDDQLWMTHVLIFGGVVLIIEISVVVGFMYRKMKKDRQ